jgi:hypothetical protein
MRDRTVADLLALLEDEAAAILAGDLAALDRLAPRKRALADDLLARTPPEADRAALGRSAERNARLLRAALAGVRAARDSIARARDGAAFDSYGKDGAAIRIAPARQSLERKA